MDPLKRTSTITIRESDNPYGVFEFKQPVYKVEEGNKNMTLYIMRSMGLMKSVRVFYETVQGAGSNASLPGQDYIHTRGHIIFTPGQSVGIVNVTIIDDDVPEIDEEFYVNITDIQVEGNISHSRETLFTIEDIF